MKLEHVRHLYKTNGLNNKADPMRGTDPGTKQAQTWEWLTDAKNVNITDAGGLARRKGYQSFLAATGITGSYSTFDFTRAYIITNETLTRINNDGTSSTLQDSITGVPFWAEINDVVYLSCGGTKLQINADNTVERWGVPTPSTPSIDAVFGTMHPGVVQVVLTYVDSAGREGGASAFASTTVTHAGGVSITNIQPLAGYRTNVYLTEPDGTVFYLAKTLTNEQAYNTTQRPAGVELTTQFLDEPPDGQYVTFLGANAYVAEYIPEIDQTVVWFSQPMGYHLFNLNSDFFVVPGEVTQLFGTGTALLITTQSRVFVYDNDKLTQVAEYGAPHGQHADIGEDGKIYFWSKRGLCRIAPFENLTDVAVSVAPGTSASGTIMSVDGHRRYMALLHSGGDAFNRR